MSRLVSERHRRRRDEDALYQRGRGFSTGDLIRVVNDDTALVSVSLHLYSRHVNHTHCFRFDPDQRTLRAFVLKGD